VDSISSELDLPVNQVLAFFNKTIRKIASHLRELIEKHVERSELISDKTLARMEQRAGAMAALPETLAQDHKQESDQFAQKQRALLMAAKDLSQHTINVEAEDLESSLQRGLKRQKAIPSSVSVPASSASAGAGAGGAFIDDGKSSGGEWGANLSGNKSNKKDKDKEGKEKRKSNGDGDGGGYKGDKKKFKKN
jgi:hypothetical protein